MHNIRYNFFNEEGREKTFDESEIDTSELTNTFFGISLQNL
jgi:hypothetical protein